MASKAEKRRRKRRLVHQGAVPVDGGQAPDDGDEAAADPADPTPTRLRGPRRAERNVDDERPPAPWGRFPLTELAVFFGIVMLVAGLFFVAGDRGKVLVLAGAGLGALGGLDTALREHFAGFRSHTLLLAGVPAALTLAVLVAVGPESLTRGVALLIALGVFAASAVLFGRIFRDRSGGRWFRLGGRN